MKTSLVLLCFGLFAIGAQAGFYDKTDNSQPGIFGNNDQPQTCEQDTCANPNAECVVLDNGGELTEALGVDCGCDSLNTNAFGDNCQFCNLRGGGLGDIPQHERHVRRILIAVMVIQIVVVMIAWKSWINHRFDANIPGRSPISHYLQNDPAMRTDTLGELVHNPKPHTLARGFMKHIGNTWEPPSVDNWTWALTLISLGFLIYWQFLMTPIPYTENKHTFTLTPGGHFTKCYFYGGIATLGLALIFTGMNTILDDVFTITTFGEEVVALRHEYYRDLAKKGKKQKDKDAYFQETSYLTSPFDSYGMIPNAWSGGWWGWLYRMISGSVLILGVVAAILAGAAGNRSCCDLFISTDEVALVLNSIIAAAFWFQFLTITVIFATLSFSVFLTPIRKGSDKKATTEEIRVAMKEALAWRTFHATSSSAQSGYFVILFALWATAGYIAVVLTLDGVGFNNNESLRHYPWKMHTLIVFGFVWMGLFLVRHVTFFWNSEKHMAGLTSGKDSETAADHWQAAMKVAEQLKGESTSAQRVLDSGAARDRFSQADIDQFKVDYSTLAEYSDNGGAMRTKMHAAHAFNNLLMAKAWSNAGRDCDKRFTLTKAELNNEAAASASSAAARVMTSASGAY